MKALLLDLDRTLVDVQSSTDYGSALAEVTRVLGDGLPDVELPPTGWSSSTFRCMAILTALAGDARWTTASALIERHEVAALPHSRPMPGLAELMEALPSGLPVAVVTLLGSDAARRALEMHGVPVRVVVPRRPDLRPKPAPDQVLEACRLLEVEARQTVMVGDSTWDREAARSAGARFMGVTNHRPSEFPADTETADDLIEIARRLTDA